MAGTWLDAASLQEIIAGFVAGEARTPSERLVGVLATAAGCSTAVLRAAFEARSRAAGQETALFDDMPFSGSG